MSAQTQATRLAAMWRLVTGIQNAFDEIPRTIDDSELPAVVLFPGEATYSTDEQGDQLVTETRLWRMVVFIQRAAYGDETQGQLAIMPFFSRVRDYFVARPGLELDTATEPQDVSYDSKFLGDGGYEVVMYPTGGTPPIADYHAIEFRLQTIEMADIAYQD